jgi:hypothetical protein
VVSTTLYDITAATDVQPSTTYYDYHGSSPADTFMAPALLLLPHHLSTFFLSSTLLFIGLWHQYTHPPFPNPHGHTNKPGSPGQLQAINRPTV